jgi:hypothetical protein
MRVAARTNGAGTRRESLYLHAHHWSPDAAPSEEAKDKLLALTQESYTQAYIQTHMHIHEHVHMHIHIYIHIVQSNVTFLTCLTFLTFVDIALLGQPTGAACWLSLQAEPAGSARLQVPVLGLGRGALPRPDPRTAQVWGEPLEPG